MNTKKVMGIVTVSLIVGGTIYFIKKSRDAKQVEEEIISLDEARKMVDEARVRVEETTIAVAKTLGMDEEELEELLDEARDEAGWNSSFAQADYDFYDGLKHNEPLVTYMTEEDKVLRFEPNSIQARDQFIKMQLAELIPSEREYQMMKRLFDFQFEPLNSGDEVLYEQLVDYRIEFFGEGSRWNHMISMADVIVHYARRTEFELGEDIGYWIIEFLHYTDFSEIASTQAFEDIIVALNQHNYYHRPTDTFSFFGLSSDEYDTTKDMSQHTVDGEVTYDIEFNTFLKSRV